MRGYGLREVSSILGLSPNQVRSYVRAGFLNPGRLLHAADAHCNAALLQKRHGNEAAALRHLQTYRRLTRAHP